MQEKGIKPLLGTKIYCKYLLNNGVTISGYVTLVALNHDGWKELISLSSGGYAPIHYNESDRPILPLSTIVRAQNCAVLVGCQESILFNSIFGNQPAYSNPIVDNSLSDASRSLIEYLQSNCGDRLFFQVERISGTPASLLAADVVAERARLYGIKCIAADATFYSSTFDKSDHNIITSTKLNVPLNLLGEATRSLEYNIYSQLNKHDFSLRTPAEFALHYTDEEIKNTLLLSDMCGEYSVLSKPNLPKFVVPSGYTEDEYLKQLCREGWAKKIAGKIDESRTKEYVARVLHELTVISDANLSAYFLIVQEFVNWNKNNGWLVGPGRGSGAGCFVSYLTNITTIDPVAHGLLFERFYNAGRNTKDEVAMPDIDCDFQPSKRELTINHLAEIYGRERVGQVVTFSRLSGRSALKEVLRASTACSPSEMDEITSYLPQEDKISDRLEEEHETSIIRWTLNNEPKSLERWARITDNGIDGSLGVCFAQAIRIEGIYKSFGKHASAVVLSGSPLSEIMPMIKEKNGDELIIGMEYDDAVKMGALKLDILGLTALDKLMDINQLLRYGRVQDET